MKNINNPIHRPYKRFVNTNLNLCAETSVDPWHDLANAIVAQAVADYRRALYYNDICQIRTLKHFFLSSWCEILTDLEMGEISYELEREGLYIG